MKKCTKCCLMLDLSNFYSKGKTASRLFSCCKSCYLAQQKRDRKPVKFRDTLKTRYGLTVDQYNRLVADSCGVCAICGRENLKGMRLFIDHDHVTKKVRELLCINCNSMLGMANDSLVVLEAAIKYLKKHSVKNTQVIATEP